MRLMRTVSGTNELAWVPVIEKNHAFCENSFREAKYSSPMFTKPSAFTWKTLVKRGLPLILARQTAACDLCQDPLRFRIGLPLNQNVNGKRRRCGTVAKACIKRVCFTAGFGPGREKKKKAVALIGRHEGPAGQAHSWLAESRLYRAACLVHLGDAPSWVNPEARDASQFDAPTETSFKDLPLVCRTDWPAALQQDGIQHVLATLDEAGERLAAPAQAEAAALTLISAIHPSVRLTADPLLGKNVILRAGVRVVYCAEIRDDAFLNTNAQVDHHDVIETGAIIDPCAMPTGNVTVSAGAYRCGN